MPNFEVVCDSGAEIRLNGSHGIYDYSDPDVQLDSTAKIPCSPKIIPG
jgi:hypothetical protein